MNNSIHYSLPYLRISLAFQHVIAIGGLYYYGLSWAAGLVMAIGYMTAIVSSEVGLHRYFSHRSFETTKFGENFLLFLSFFCYLGPSIWYVGTHRLHHRYADTPKDPHTPIHNHPLKIWIFWWKDFTIPTKYVMDLCRDKRHIFIIRNYFYILAVIDTTMFLISPFFACFFLTGTVLFYHGLMAVNVIGHLNQKHKTYSDAPASDIVALSFITFGTGNHNTHHKHYDVYHQSMDGKFDLMGILIKKVFLKG